MQRSFHFSIQEANMEVMAVTKLTARVVAEKKAVKAKYAAKNGIIATLGYFAEVYPDGSLKENMIRGWKKEYLKELARRKGSDKEFSVKLLPSSKIE